jgi:hypothetical protein
VCKHLPVGGVRRVGAPGEGTVFGLPLPDGQLMIGVVIRRYPKVVRVGMMPDSLTELPSSASSVTPSGVGIVGQLLARALDAGEWPVVGAIDGFDPAEWPSPPMLPGERDDKAQTPETFRDSMAKFVRRRRLRVMRDRTWIAEHPHLTDPLVGTHYIALPAGRIRPYVEERLSRCGTLGAIVLQHTDLDEGGFISTVPREIGVDAAAAFPDSGGKSSDRGRNLIRGHLVHPDGSRTPVHGDRLSAITMVSEWLGSGPGHLVIFRDVFADRTQATRDPDRDGGRMAIHDDGVYVVVPPGPTPEIVMSDFLRRPDFAKVAFLADLETLLDGRVSLATQDFVELAGALEAIVIGAYDGEGYIVWTRTLGDRWLVG